MTNTKTRILDLEKDMEFWRETHGRRYNTTCDDIRNIKECLRDNNDIHEKQITINESISELLKDHEATLKDLQTENTDIVCDILDLKAEISFLKKLTAGLAFAVAGMTIGLIKARSCIDGIRKVMNEG